MRTVWSNKAHDAPEKTNQTGGGRPDLTASTLATPLTSVPRTPSFFSSPTCALASLRRPEPFFALSLCYLIRLSCFLELMSMCRDARDASRLAKWFEW